MNVDGKTRHSRRIKKVNGLARADPLRREAFFQERIDLLESDQYQTPEKLAQKNEDEGRKKSRIKNKKELQLKRKFNLKKMLKDNKCSELDEPNFVTVRAGPSIRPCSKTCSICGMAGRGRCPACYESFCGLRCHRMHKEIKCSE